MVTHATWPAVGIDQAFTLLTGMLRHAGDPRQAWPEPAQGLLPGPFGFYTVMLLVFAAETVLLAFGVRWFRGDRPTRGMAATADLDKTLSSAAVLARGRRIRPGLTGKPALADVAVDLGTVGRRHLYAGLESSVLLIAPPRQGKTSQVIIPWLRSFPGAAVVTSVRTDVLQATAALRRGTAWLLDLDTHTVWPHQVRWTPIAGAADFDVAYRRADVMIQVGKQDSASDSSNAGFFAMTATNLLACWLHTAALTSRTMDDVLTWSLDASIDTPIKLLRDASGAREGVVKLLDAFYRQPDSTRANLWSTVQTGTSVLLGRTAARVFSGPATDSFDIEAFLRSGCDTLYLVVDEKKADALAPLITAFVEEITTVAIGLAKQSENLRLDPPLGLILDEVSNVVPLPDLPNTMSFAAGFGIFTVAVLQNLAAAERRWHRVGREELWKNSTVKIALGGLAGDDLDAFSQLAGTYRETLIIPQHHRDHVTLQASVVDRKTLSPDAIRTLDERRREALIIHATTPPVITRMQRHYEGPHAADHTRAIAHAHTLMHPEPATGATP
ncbi:type IV secretory system conjugative DNA transfer family protein [Actinoplanes sp. RD1]|uniref:type IV secretory system conjugative DNA transfer family protein n=1 Tax=Actinoplanes sp. RD1 TaxID=3064538 RepID=UPI0027416B58|nr:type IV secretory system conjugative DNA transfer family protein [Actinoplanes sp. RD1]